MSKYRDYGAYRQQFERNRKRILKEQCLCGICGQEVDKTIRYPHPMSATVDHIIPINRGGHPSDINNLQLSHFRCNRMKSDMLPSTIKHEKEEEIGNRNLPLLIDWMSYRSEQNM
ncbi:MAG: HNH endonuclease [Holdemanella sp.]|nr:HNH endonuclease [Holdemanella sp.]